MTSLDRSFSVVSCPGAPQGSFGQKLLNDLLESAPRFGTGKVSATFDPMARPEPHQFPVIWERHDVLNGCVEQRRSALLINDRPRSGLNAIKIDSVSMDDFAGGLAAGEYMRRVVGADQRFCVLGGPRRDRRSRERVGGFTNELEATTVWASSRFVAAAKVVAPQLLAAKPAGVFCCNDRLAEGLLAAAARLGRPVPRMIGFDDAPIAAQMSLSTIAIPWAQLAEAALQRVRHRLRGERGPASYLLFYPQLVPRRNRPTMLQST